MLVFLYEVNHQGKLASETNTFGWMRLESLKKYITKSEKNQAKFGKTKICSFFYCYYEKLISAGESRH